MKTYRNILLLILVMVYQTVNGQNFNDIINRISNAYMAKGGLGYNISYKYYKDSSSSEPYESISGNVRFNQGYYYSKLNNVEITKNPNYYVMVDKKDKLIMLDKNHEAYKSNFSYVLDTSYLKYESIKTYNNAIQLAYNESSIYDYAVIKYSADKYLFTSIKVYYKQVEHEGKKYNPMIHISYTNYIEGIKTSDNVFSEMKYLNYIDGVWAIKPQFKNYQLINNISN